MKQIKFNSTAKVYISLEELDEKDRILVLKARDAAKNAYAPYSHFKVGAAVLLSNGEVIQGNNQENAAYPSGLCAERVAIFAAFAKYPDAVVKAIAITALSDDFVVDTPITPCGACRQVLAEYEYKSGKDMKLILCGVKGEILIIKNVKTLLPFVFDASKLKKNLKK